MPWYHGWNIVIAGLVFQAISFGIGIYCFTFWVAPWSAEFGVGRGDIMLVFFTLQVSMGLLAPFAGQAMDRLSVRALVCAGAVSLAVALVLAARATALWQLVVLYGSLVVGGTLLAGPLAAQTLTARWFGRRRGGAWQDEPRGGETAAAFPGRRDRRRPIPAADRRAGAHLRIGVSRVHETQDPARRRSDRHGGRRAPRHARHLSARDG